MIFLQDLPHLDLELVVDNYPPVFIFGHEIQETVGGVAVMPRKGKQGELSVQEDYRVACFDEVLRRGGSARSGREVVEEADGLLLQWDGGPAGSD